VCIATEESYFVLKYDADAVARARETKEDVTEDGVETAFDVKTSLWTK
jgi:coatomer subunit beta'